MIYFLKEHSTVFSVQLKAKKEEILINYLFFPNPKQFIPDPDPRQNFGSKRIRILNTK